MWERYPAWPQLDTAPTGGPIEWYWQVQFVAAVPMPPDKADEFGTTVNGMWADPESRTMVEVERARDRGRRVLFSVPMIALTPRVYEKAARAHLLDEVCATSTARQRSAIGATGRPSPSTGLLWDHEHMVFKWDQVLIGDDVVGGARRTSWLAYLRGLARLDLDLPRSCEHLATEADYAENLARVHGVATRGGLRFLPRSPMGGAER